MIYLVIELALGDNLVSLYYLGTGLSTSDKTETNGGLNKTEAYILSYFKVLEVVSKELDLSSLEMEPRLTLFVASLSDSQDHNITHGGCQSSSLCFCIPAKKEENRQRRVLFKDMSQKLHKLFPFIPH